MNLYFQAKIKPIAWIVFLFLTFAITSCSDNQYIDSIPGNCTALMSIDAQKVKGVDAEHILKSLLPINNISDCGIDFKSKIYLFETADGNIGICARLKDSDKYEDTLSKAKKTEYANAKTKSGINFVMINDAWLSGHNDNTLMLLGPITLSVRGETENVMVRYFGQDESVGITHSLLFARIDTLDSPISLVARMSSLPEKFAAPFTLGMPKDADASQVLLSAKLTFKDKTLKIEGETFSNNPKTDNALKEAYKGFRPISNKLISCFRKNQCMGFYMNVEGSSFLSLLQCNKEFQAMLAGLNTAIDMNMIIKSIEGDFAITVPAFTGDNIPISVAAKTSNSNWLKDVDYWKQSCPAGSKIVDSGKNAFCYKSGNTSFVFGVSADNMFYSGRNMQEAKNSIIVSADALPKQLINDVVGKRMAMLVNIGAISNNDTSVAKLLKNKLNYILYYMK